MADDRGIPRVGEPELVNVAGAARFLGTSARHIRRLVTEPAPAKSWPVGSV
jgi:hypothetical protein